MFTAVKFSRYSLLQQRIVTRPFSSSPVKNRALPFSLSGNAETVQVRDGSEDGQTLRMIIFGKPGAGKVCLIKKYLYSSALIRTPSGHSICASRPEVRYSVNFYW